MYESAAQNPTAGRYRYLSAIILAIGIIFMVGVMVIKNQSIKKNKYREWL
jgi:succinate dehydrogenase hydrophobic anchor subunit